MDVYEIYPYLSCTVPSVIPSSSTTSSSEQLPLPMLLTKVLMTYLLCVGVTRIRGNVCRNGANRGWT